MAYGPQNNPLPTFEKHTQNHEISAAAQDAYLVMHEAAQNAYFGLLPSLEEFKKPVNKPPVDENHPHMADFEAYRKRNAAGQNAASVALIAENHPVPVKDEQLATVTSIAGRPDFLAVDNETDQADKARAYIKQIYADDEVKNSIPVTPENPWENRDAA